jgi:hypothetical protein
MGGHAQDVHGPGLDVHHEQDIKALEQHGVDVQEVTGKDARCLNGEELPAQHRDLVPQHQDLRVLCGIASR